MEGASTIEGKVPSQKKNIVKRALNECSKDATPKTTPYRRPQGKKSEIKPVKKDLLAFSFL
jgi:hypothetical protein